MKKMIYAVMLAQLSILIPGLLLAENEKAELFTEETAVSTIPDEVAALRENFAVLVGGIKVEDAPYLEAISRDAAQRLIALEDGGSRSQYFVYADRNPRKQIVFVGFFNAVDRTVTIIGVDKTSCGNGIREEFFDTPTGAFRNSTDNSSYRALGTRNAKGWMGLGAKGSRVWDFGWQRTVKNGQEPWIRLLMHATDPVFGEARLGKVDSKGCVRIPAKLNRFLDHYGILDREYELKKDSKRVSWVLKPDREPAIFAGKYMLVGDSSLMKPAYTPLQAKR